MKSSFTRPYTRIPPAAPGRAAAALVAAVAGIAVVLLPPLSARALAQDAQETTIVGTVTSETGEPLISASVAVEELNIATVTGDAGTYSLVVPAARAEDRDEVQVIARLVGYQSQTATVALTGGEVTQDFELGFDPVRLEEIIATGQGTQQQRRELTTAIATIDSEELEYADQSNIVEALAGKAAGVDVTSSGGEPGAGSYFHIRGFKTLTGDNQPLLVVDGTPISNESNNLEGAVGGTAVQNRASDIDPDDIASIEILKGPAASSIYGSAGANGVVLITTKSGTPGATRMTIETSYSLSDVNITVPLQTQYGQSGVVSWGPRLGCAPNCVFGQQVFDHAEEVFDTGNELEGNVTLSGGSERTHLLPVARLPHQ